MMLIIEIHVDTIEETNSSTRTRREDERPNRADDKTQTGGSRIWKAFKHRVPGYLIQYHKNEK